MKREVVIAGLASEGLALLLGGAEAGSSAVVQTSVCIFFISLYLCLYIKMCTYLSMIHLLMYVYLSSREEFLILSLFLSRVF